MNEQKIATVVIEDKPVTGFATNIEEGTGLSEADLALRLQEVSLRLGAGIPGNESAAGDLLRKIISRVRGRKMVENHGVHEVEVPWLCLHVPVGGSAHLQLTGAQSGSEGIKFSLVGTGLGDGWSFKANLQRDFLPRPRCMALVETFHVRVRGYAYQDAPSDIEYRSDVVEHIRTSVRELTRCPLCQPLPEDPQILSQKAGPAIDLSADPIGQKISQQQVLVGTSELEIGLKAELPGDLGVSAGVTCKREVSFTCSVDYAFLGGKRYQPMQRLQYVDLPFWRIG
jgi:hypothetical protein